MNSTSALRSFGDLPADLLSNICTHLDISDIINVGRVRKHLGNLVDTRIYKEIKKLRVEVDGDHPAIQFTFKNGRTNEIKLDQVDWEDIVKRGKCIETIELEINPEKSTSQLFHVFKRASFSLKTLKINVLGGSVQRVNMLHQRCIALVSQHRSTLLHLEASTPDEQHVIVQMQRGSPDMKLTYEQSVEPLPSDKTKQAQNQQFVYNMFHELLGYRTNTNVTLEIGNKFDANLALQKAFQVAIPHVKRKILESLTIEFKNSLQQVTEDEMKQVLLRHVDEFHFTTPNLQHFHCSLPHDEMDLSQEFLAQLNEPVRKSRRSPKSMPYNSSISLRPVRCK